MSEVVELLQALIRNECVNTGKPDSGHEYRSVKTLQEFFGVQGMVFEPAPGRQSLVYRIAGSDPHAPSLALVPHIDVVPADPDGWTYDPFGAEIVDGFIYGRGAVDMLNIVSAFAKAARPYIRGERRPRGDLVFAAVADEEAGGMKGGYRLTRDHWDLVGADYMLTEVAYPRVTPGSAIPVAVGEKGSFFTRLKTTGTPAHASAPYGADNALAKMIEALHNIVNTEVPAVVDDQWSTFVDGAGLCPDLAARLKNPATIEGAIAEIAECDAVFAGWVHAATHLTVTPTHSIGGFKSNVIPDRAKTELDIRSPPGMTRDSVNEHLRAAMGAAGEAVEIEPRGNNPSKACPTDTELWQVISDAMYEVDGHRDLVPALMPVATDARFWRSRGSVAYGVGIYDDATSFSDLLSRFHGHDERISIESLERTTALYQQILERLDEPR